MTQSTVVFLLDVDNTLLNNDRVTADLQHHLRQSFGLEREHRYWMIFEQRRRQLGYSDYLGALQQYRAEYPEDPQFMQTSFFLLDYPFANRLYPGARSVIKHLDAWGPTVILSDGDIIFQPRKILRSGLYDSVGGRVLIYIHKERQMDDVANRFPAMHYVMMDDKLRILTAMKEKWGSRLTTVFIRQGHYALDPEIVVAYPPADITIEHIGELLHFHLADLLAAGQDSHAASLVGAVQGAKP